MIRGHSGCTYVDCLLSVRAWYEDPVSPGYPERSRSMWRTWWSLLQLEVWVKVWVWGSMSNLSIAVWWKKSVVRRGALSAGLGRRAMRRYFGSEHQPETLASHTRSFAPIISSCSADNSSWWLETEPPLGSAAIGFRVPSLLTFESVPWRKVLLVSMSSYQPSHQQLQGYRKNSFLIVEAKEHNEVIRTGLQRWTNEAYSWPME